MIHLFVFWKPNIFKDDKNEFGDIISVSFFAFFLTLFEALLVKNNKKARDFDSKPLFQKLTFPIGVSLVSSTLDSGLKDPCSSSSQDIVTRLKLHSHSASFHLEV